MTQQNAYELMELADDRIKTIHDEVKSIGPEGEGGAKVLVRLLSTIVVLGAALSIVIGQ
jgi:hypothetical protein